jgi:hypothetical protein
MPRFAQHDSIRVACVTYFRDGANSSVTLAHYIVMEARTRIPFP